MFKKIKAKFLRIFGDIKIFKYPFWIVYDPDLYQVSGSKIRMIIETLEPGDIVARGYKHYADGFFIPGEYSHTGVYTGDGTIVHAVKDGVAEIDILDFIQCDRVCIIRSIKKPPEWYAQSAVVRARNYIGTKYDYEFSPGDETLYCHEMTAMCFPNHGIEKVIAHMNGWLRWIKKKEPVYLVDSFLSNPNFKVVYKTN